MVILLQKSRGAACRALAVLRCGGGCSIIPLDCSRSEPRPGGADTQQLHEREGKCYEAAIQISKRVTRSSNANTLRVARVDRGED